MPVGDFDAAHHVGMLGMLGMLGMRCASGR
jgi:hypothetical protein